MKPVLAIIGRPNVGKSTLFNRFCRSRDALVADFPGLTRDRKYGELLHQERSLIVIDTGGLSGAESGIDAAMAAQSRAAVMEADHVLFVVDARAGLTVTDEQIGANLREQGKPVTLVVNKVDGLSEDQVLLDFYALGLERMVPVSASNNRGIRSLLDRVCEALPEADSDAQSAEEEAARGIVIGMIGRPNVGKSTLVNRMLGEERVVVYDQPGTTRDSILIPFERQGERYTLVDTAGVRRRKNVDESVEKFSIVKTLQAIRDSHVVILLMDAREGIVDQDLHLLGFAMESGRAIILAINKWDGLSVDERDAVKADVERRLGFAGYARLHFISALHGSGVGLLYDSVQECYRCAMQKWSTSLLTRYLEDATANHPPPMVNGRRIKMRLAHQGGSNPPRIVIHGTQVEKLPNSYRRYLENEFRKALDVRGSPIHFEFKSSENPFAGRVNRLTPRQQRKRERMMEHIRKSKHRKKRRQR